MAGLSSNSSATDFEAYMRMRPTPEGTAIHRSSRRGESPASSNSRPSGLGSGAPFEDSWEALYAESSDPVSSKDLLPHERDRPSPSWSEFAREIEDVLKGEPPLTGYSYEDIGVPSMGGRPFVGEDWAEMVEEESLQARALKFNNPVFVRDFFEGKQGVSIAARRGVADPPTLRAVSPVQSPALTPVQSSTLQSDGSAALSWPFPSPASAASRSPPSSAQSRVFESPRLYRSPDHASLGDGPYTQNLLLQVTRQLNRLLDAYAEQKDEIEKRFRRGEASTRRRFGGT